MKKSLALSLCAVLLLTFPACSNPCAEGHTWEDATCETAKTCSVCNATEGEPLGHIWKDATCTKPKTCSRCSKTSGSTASHNYNETGVCKNCGATKQYQNSYGYFSATDLFSMAKDAVENYAYPSYVYNYCSSSDIHIEKVTDAKLQYGSDSFSVVAYADFVINGVTYENKAFVAVVEPHTATTYRSKDVYIG